MMAAQNVTPELTILASVVGVVTVGAGIVLWGPVQRQSAHHGGSAVAAVSC